MNRPLAEVGRRMSAQGKGVRMALRGMLWLMVWVQLCAAAPVRAEEEPVRLQVRQVLLVGEDPAVLLLDAEEKRYLLIFIDMFMANAIRMGMTETRPERPLTHDLFGIVLRRLGARVTRVRITALKGHTYHALIDIEVNGEQAEFDARPSDALALAVRDDVPIFTDPDLLKPMGAEGKKEPSVPPGEVPHAPDEGKTRKGPRGAT